MLPPPSPLKHAPQVDVRPTPDGLIAAIFDQLVTPQGQFRRMRNDLDALIELEARRFAAFQRFMEQQQPQQDPQIDLLPTTDQQPPADQQPLQAQQTPAVQQQGRSPATRQRRSGNAAPARFSAALSPDQLAAFQAEQAAKILQLRAECASSASGHRRRRP